MIKCPNCGGLNPQTSSICGACGTSLESVKNANNINNNNNSNNEGLNLYEGQDFNSDADGGKIKNKHVSINFSHIILFIFSILSWLFIPFRWLKLLLAFIFFYYAETSNSKNSIILVLTRIVTAIQIWGVVIAIILKLSASAETVAKYFEYFRF